MKNDSAKNQSIRIGGAEEARTSDLFNAIEALSQLSYSPILNLEYVIYPH